MARGAGAAAAVPDAAAPPAGAGTAPAPGGAAASPDVRTLIEQAARELAEYQRLTAEGRLGEAGQRLEALKKLLDQLNKGGEQR
jgi:hypothetical protein